MNLFAQAMGSAEPASSILARLLNVDGPSSELDADLLDGHHAAYFEPAFAKNTAFNKDFGSAADTVTQGNDPRLSDARVPVTHTHDWDELNDPPATYVPSVHIHNASDITSGIIDIDRLPQGALERLVIVANQTARFALTTTEVQTGDTVKQDDTGIMYRVVDDTQLNSSAGYTEYTASRASAVDWSGVENKPSTYTPSAHSLSFHSDCTGTTALRTSTSTTLLLQAKGMNDHVTSGDHDGRYYTETETDNLLAAKENAFSKNTAFNKAFGSTSGTVCEGDDPRLTDERPPGAHASTHITGGSDVVPTVVAGGAAGSI